MESISRYLLDETLNNSDWFSIEFVEEVRSEILLLNNRCYLTQQQHFAVIVKVKLILKK